MAISNIQPQIGPRHAVRIITVDQKRMRVEVQLRDGGLVWVQMDEAASVFRWPITDELWMARQDGGIWTLNGAINPANALRDGDKEYEGSISPEDMYEGEVRVVATANSTGSGAWLNNHQIPRKWNKTIGDGASTEFILKHKMDTEDVDVALRLDGLKVITNTDILSGNKVRLRFAEPPADKSIRVIITG